MSTPAASLPSAPWAGQWPDDLIRRVANRDYVLVIGAGASASSANGAGVSPPSWRVLLGLLLNTHGAIPPGAAEVEAANLISTNQFLEAAQAIQEIAASRSQAQQFLSTITTAVEGPVGNYFQKNNLHDALLDLEPNVIVTTNYDRLIERASASGFNVHPYTSKTVGSDLRRGTPLLLKIHGTVDSAQEMILTRTDFAKVRRDGKHALDALQALFFTKTTLFVGYGFADPDLHLLLENAVGPIGGPPGHYWLTDDGIPAHMVKIARECYGTEPILYQSGQYGQVVDAVSSLASSATAMRLGI